MSRPSGVEAPMRLLPDGPGIVWGLARACIRNGLDADAAVSRFGGETGVEHVGATGAVDDPGDQLEVHAADEVAVLLGEGVEWAVGEDDLTAAQVRFVSVALEDVDERCSTLGTTGALTTRDVSGITDAPPHLGGHSAQHPVDR